MTNLEPVRFSRLKKMGLSAAHYAADQRQGTSAMSVGTAAHSLILGGPPVVAYPGAVRRGKEWEAFQAENADACILTKREAEQANAIAESVRRCSLSMRLLEGRHEVELPPWRVGGRVCGGRVDVIGDLDGGHVCELKTSNSAEPYRFTRLGLRMAYHAQLAWYQHGAMAGAGLDVGSAYIVAVETSPPYVVTPMRVTFRALEMGTRIWRSWFERLRVCEESGEWPPYVQHVTDFDIEDEEPELVFADEEEAA